MDAASTFVGIAALMAMMWFVRRARTREAAPATS
jgi:hypothetical protein